MFRCAGQAGGGPLMSNVRPHKMPFHEDRLLETFKSLILISIDGLKALLLINGGAVVALLAFLGQSSLGPSIAPRAAESIAWFVAGTALSTFAFLGSYATQFALYNERLPTGYRGPRHMTFPYCTLMLVIASLGCFAIGSFASLRLFASQSQTATLAAAPSPELPSASAVARPPLSVASSAQVGKR
jgi:hypothetical protein